MLDRLTGLPLHRFFYITALVLIAIGVSLNKVVMSVGTIMLFSSWVLEGEYKEKIARIPGNKLFWVSISLYLLHIIGLVWTSDFDYAFHDLRAKLPLIAIPFVLATIPAISKFEFKIVLYSFIGTIILTTLINFLVAKGVFTSTREIQSFRDYSIFISHIRLSLMIDFAIFALLFIILKQRKSYVFALPLLVWLLYYAYFSQIISGFIYLILLFLAASLFIAWRSENRYIKIGMPISIFVIIGIVVFWMQSIVSDYYAIPKEEKGKPEFYTANGNPYNHNWNSELRENGNLIYWYLCHEEISREWAKKMGTNIDSILPQTGVPIRFTLYRYMTAKGLRKDSLDFHKLSDDDIANVLKGYNNPIQTKGGIKSRIYGLLSNYEEWKQNEDPNNKTLLQRFSYWEAGIDLFKNNFLIGVGTGDNQKEFASYYDRNNSKLTKENRSRSHNQFLTIAVCFGLVGLIVFAVFLYYPLFIKKRKLEFLHLIFIILMTLSFLPEDTLETQSGVSFFSLFYSLFLFRKRS